MNDRDSGFSKTAGGFKTFLLVDDEQAILDCTTLLLEARGNRVFAVASIAAAVQVMEQKSDEIDCLIIDHSMPETNGLQLMNCLLYTSPSPRDATLSRMPSSA